MIINDFLRTKKLPRFLRKYAESFGIERFSKPALYNLDDKLGKYLNQEKGFFIEAGANDGYTQSNTYYLENFKDWTGILVEPIPERFKQCKKERKKSIVYNCALVSKGYPEQYISMVYSDLMSIVEDAHFDGLGAKEHAQRGILAQDYLNQYYEFEIPTRTLEDILLVEKPSQINFLSLDVEGYELEVLKGLNIRVFRPNYILVETIQKNDIFLFLEKNDYQMIESLTRQDVLFRDISLND